jgi:hypothetical protein
MIKIIAFVKVTLNIWEILRKVGKDGALSCEEENGDTE